MSDASAKLWSVPLRAEQVSESGRHVVLEADASVRAALARFANLTRVEGLRAELDIARRGAEGLRVTGRVQATIGQVCVVSLEPLTNTIDETVDVTFAPGIDPIPPRPDGDETEAHMMTDGPEPLIDGAIDLGAIAAEFFLLGVDPYPRKDDAVFEAPPEEPGAMSPFAALAALKKKH